MITWLPYPKNKPADTLEAQEADYAVLISNPYRVSKKCLSTTNIPLYRLELALWLGDHWLPIDADYIGEHSFDVKFFIQLPPHP